ncbi:MAG: C25 family cysteine peptidase [bacterium]
MKKMFFLFLTFSFLSLAGLSVEIEIPEIELIENDDGVIPAIVGYELDGTGEKVILPYKKLTFFNKVKFVEVVEQKEVFLQGPLKKGRPLYRLSDMRKVKKVHSDNTLLPTVSQFAFHRAPAFRGAVKEFSVDIYPVIPVSDTKVIKIDKIKVHFESSSFVPANPSKAQNSILILTSNDVVSKSKEISNYVAVKRADGFKVEIATEENYGGGELKGIERVKKIREYLNTRHKDFFYLLIIDDPLPDGKGVPMVVAIPDELEEKNYEAVPTDIFYAETSEEIDKNNNGIYGERADKIVFSFEFVVGRIPVYAERIDNVDKILKRTIDFIKEKPSTASYREQFLFPTTIAYYENQDGMFTPKMDGAYVVEFMEQNSLKDLFDFKLLVETAGISPSEFAGEEETASYANVLKYWNEGFGAVYWMGHGMPTYTVRTIWAKDRNNNGYADSYELSVETFVDSNMTESMTHIAPFVFQGSCLNGTIQNHRNLAYMTLLNSAVGVVGSSQVSYGTIFKGYNLSSQDLFAYGAVFIDALANNTLPAVVLQQKKESWSNRSVLLTIKMETNYFGDPSLNLNLQKCENDEECDDHLFCNGTEKCVSGYCEKNHDAIPCSTLSDPCKTIVCDESSKSCVEEFAVDGLYCGDSVNPCYERMQCLEGKCVEFGAKDCSGFDSPCSKGVCNDKTGLCELFEENKGKPCDTGRFCVIDEKCVKGVCQGEDVDLPEPDQCSKVVCDDASESFIQLTDQSLNWTSCVTTNGLQGTCYYGVCRENEVQKKTKSNSGCSITLF